MVALLEHDGSKACVHAQDNNGMSALAFAASRGQTDAVKLILLDASASSKRELLGLKNAAGSTALELARIGGHEETARVLQHARLMR